MTRANQLGLLALTVTLIAACGSQIPVHNAPANPNAYNGTLQMTWVGSSLITIGFGKNVQGVVQLTAGGQPVAGATVTFSVNGTANGSYLQQNTNTTDGNGKATVNILAGTAAASFQVGATTAGLAAPSYVNVDVNGKYLGDVVVRTNGYTGPGKPQFYIVRLHDANVEGAGCATFRPDQPPAAIDQMQVADVRLDTVFAGPHSQQDGLSLYATVVGVDGVRPVVYGCGGPVTVKGENRVYIQVSLQTADAGLEGDYAFGQDIQPLKYIDPTTPVGYVLRDVTGVLNNTGNFLAGGIYTGDPTPIGACTLISSSPGVQSFCEDFAGNVFQALIDAAVKAGGDTAVAIQKGLSDGATMLTDINVGGILTITDYEKTSGAVTGTLVYDSYRFLWTEGCAANNPDPCCGHTVYNGAQLGIDPIQANFTGTATLQATSNTSPVAYSFSTQSMLLGIAYGRLAIAILEDVVFPELEGAFPVIKTWDTNNDKKIEFGELIGGLLNCVGTSDPSLQAVCSASATAVGTLLDSLVSQLQFTGTSDWNVTETITGGTLSDSDQDLQVDTLTGTLHLVPEASGSMPTTIPDLPFVAHYKGKVCKGDGDCGNGFACHFAPNADTGDASEDLNGQCHPDNQCGAIVGPDAGGMACSAATDCKSGLCMLPTGVAGAAQSRPYTCFEACQTDADCLGNGHCLVDGFIQVEASDGSTPQSLSQNDNVSYAGTCVQSLTN